VEEKPQFVVDPKDTLIPILQGTSSPPQLYVAWGVLITRMRLGVKAWEEYIAEYQLQVGATAHTSLFNYPEFFSFGFHSHHPFPSINYKPLFFPSC